MFTRSKGEDIGFGHREIKKNKNKNLKFCYKNF